MIGTLATTATAVVLGGSLSLASVAGFADVPAEAVGSTVTNAGPVLADASTPPAGFAVLMAYSALGTRYVWGGTTPTNGFDCSGLTQWAYAQAGTALPRTAQQQYTAGPHLKLGTAWQLGDLLFFGAGPTAVSHVGIYLGTSSGRVWMIDAPHTGTVVRLDPLSADPDGSGRLAFGSELLVGATRPGGAR